MNIGEQFPADSGPMIYTVRVFHKVAADKYQMHHLFIPAVSRGDVMLKIRRIKGDGEDFFLHSVALPFADSRNYHNSICSTNEFNMWVLWAGKMWVKM